MPVNVQGSTADSVRVTTINPADNNVRAKLPDEAAPGAIVQPQLFYEAGKHVGQVAAGSTKVGFTLRNSQGKIVDAFAFLINPQGLSRTLGGRASLYATKGRSYVNDFGPAAGAIVLRQLVGEGKNFQGVGSYYTGREDVQRFLKRIYLPATAGPGHYDRRVYFHDHHFERGFEERVFFPPNSLTIERDVSQHNLWRVELQMISLERFPYGEVNAQKTDSGTQKNRTYRVKHGDTLHKIVAALAGKHASKARRQSVQAKLLKLNPFIKKRRKVPGGKTGKPMHVYKGEVLVLPNST